MRACRALTLFWILAGCAGFLPACSGNGGSGFSEELLQKCALASTCALESETVSIGVICNLISAVEGLAGKSDTTTAKLSEVTLACYMIATDCDQMRACVKASDSEAQVCEAAGGTDRCSGDVLVECGDYPDKVPDAFDCGEAGLICAQDDSDAKCGEATCTPGANPRCDGHMLIRCDEVGVEVVTDCRYYTGFHCSGTNGGYACQTRAGGTCGTDPVEGDLACVGSGAACDEDTFSNRCDGSVMVTCNRGKESRLDCKDLNRELTCGIDGEYGAVVCEPALQECQVDADERCESGIVTFCWIGKLTEVDCGKYGFSGCGTETTDTRTVAFCVN